MKIQLLSDLHFEFADHRYDHIWKKEDKNPALDTVLVLAGDIDIGDGAEKFIDYVSKYYHSIILVPGNHEFYNRDFNYVIDGWKTFELSPLNKNFHFLNNDSRIIDGVRFIGGTMWTGFDNADTITMNFAYRSMNDYESIGYKGSLITPDFVLEQHKEFMKYLTKILEEPFDGDTVVVTHHSPGNGLRRTGYNDRYNFLYFADIEQFIGECDKIKLWMHGHTHQNWDYMINNTRVVCNPYGYHGESTNRGFDKNFIVEI